MPVLSPSIHDGRLRPAQRRSEFFFPCQGQLLEHSEQGRNTGRRSPLLAEQILKLTEGSVGLLVNQFGERHEVFLVEAWCGVASALSSLKASGLAIFPEPAGEGGGSNAEDFGDLRLGHFSGENGFDGTLAKIG